MVRETIRWALVMLLALSAGCAPAVIDSRLTDEEAILAHQPPGVPSDVLARLVVVNVRYHAPDGRLHQGQIVVNEAVADEVRAAFEVIRLAHYPVESVLPLAHPAILVKGPYGLSPDTGNSSGFAWRPGAGTGRLSLHSLGLAVDINPRHNPYVRGDRVLPPGARWDPADPLALRPGSPVVLAFKRMGWQWGGDWPAYKDRMHFQKLPQMLRAWAAAHGASPGSGGGSRP